MIISLVIGSFLIGWLSPVSCDKYKAVCIACKKELLAHRLTLLKHASSAKHLKKLELLNKTTSLLKYQAVSNIFLCITCEKVLSTECIKDTYIKFILHVRMAIIIVHSA